jgi:hypothetical protein
LRSASDGTACRKASSTPRPTKLTAGKLVIDLVHYEATFDGKPLDLTPKEFDFLAYLARNAGTPRVLAGPFRKGGPGRVHSVLYRPIVVSARALS